jgi:hypothetical protein
MSDSKEIEAEIREVPEPKEDADPRLGSKHSKSDESRLSAELDAQDNQLVYMKPPPGVVRPKQSISRTIQLSLIVGGFNLSNRFKKQNCARASKHDVSIKKGYWLKLPFSREGHGFSYTHEREETFTRFEVQCDPYIVVGVVGKDESVPKEVILPVKEREDLFKQLRKAKRQLRSMPRRLLSLKHVGGFGIYECHPKEGYHSFPKISDATKQTLAEFYKDMMSGEPDYEDRWLKWFQLHFNNINLENGDDSMKAFIAREHSLRVDPEDGRYALQFVLQWSTPKFIFWGFLPIVLSLVIGFWYMYKPRDPSQDAIAIIQTAWGIASYIITAAACEFTVDTG